MKLTTWMSATLMTISFQFAGCGSPLPEDAEVVDIPEELSISPQELASCPSGYGRHMIVWDATEMSTGWRHCGGGRVLHYGNHVCVKGVGSTYTVCGHTWYPVTTDYGSGYIKGGSFR